MSGVDVTAVGRALGTPLRLARSVRALSHGALSNAGRAVDEVQRAVADRFALTDGLSERTEPGDLQLLDEDTCWSLLATHQVGRLAYLARAGTPDVTPVNYTVHDRTLLVRSGVGPKLQAAERRDRVAFEVDDLDAAEEAGWSVVVHGRAELVAPSEPRADDPAPWATGPRRHVLRVVPDRVTGRRLHGGARER